MATGDPSSPPAAIPSWLYACFGMCLPPPPPPPPRAKKVPPPKPPPVPVPPWREIPMVQQYDLLKQLGKGGFSEIWLAESKATKELVAVKVVQLVNADLEPEEVTNLLGEAKYLRTLDCPYLLKCRDTVHTPEHLVLVLEYLSGGELLDHVHTIKKYTEAEAAKMFAQVASAVDYLHNLNILHRDLKPENILFERPVELCEAECRPYRIKLIDLGMAMVYDPSKPVIGCVGTPGFVAPELWNDKPSTYACDIYSLGVILFVMLTGRKPHSGVDIRMMTYCNKSIKDAPGIKDERFLSLSPDARDLLLRMLADKPEDRPTAQEVLRHPFIAAVDSNMDAHREMGEVVRRRMRDLAQLRRVHGLRYALNLQRPVGGGGQDRSSFIMAMDARRLKLKAEAQGGDASARCHHMASDLNALQDDGAPGSHATPTAFATNSGAGGSSGTPGMHHLARYSLAASFGTPPSMMQMVGHSLLRDATQGVQACCGHGSNQHDSHMHRTSRDTSAPNPGSAAHHANGTGAGAVAPSPFATVSNDTSAARPPSRLSMHDASRAAQAHPPSTGHHHTPSTPPLPSPHPDAPPQHQVSLGTDSATPDRYSREVSDQHPDPAGLAAGQHAQPGSAFLMVPEDTVLAIGTACLPGQNPAFARSTPTPASGDTPGGSAAPSRNVSHLPGSRVPTPLDPMLLVNILPNGGGLQRSNTVPLGGEEVPGGGSPVATEQIVEHALLHKCMSANDWVAELLAHQGSLEQLLGSQYPTAPATHPTTLASVAEHPAQADAPVAAEQGPQAQGNAAA